MAQELTRLGDDVKSGIRTSAVLDGDPPGLRVSWIDWDSPFRRSNLRIGDLIVGAEGQSYAPLLKPGQFSGAVGQHGETYHWKQVGALHGQALTLQILREDVNLEIVGALSANRFYYDANGKQSIAPGGPENYVSDGYSSWPGWYEKLMQKMSNVLNGGWERRSFNNQTELCEHLEHKSRVDFLVKTYPSPFADAVMEDWTRVHESLLGKRIELGELDLEYRALGGRRVEAAKVAAAQASAALREELSAQMIPTFPAVEVEKRAEMVGKVVELPWLTPRDMINDLGRAYLAVGSNSDGFYFVPLESAEMRRFQIVLYRYVAQINPQMPERSRYFARLLDEPRMLAVRGRPATGLLLQVVAGMAGEEELFVDLRGDAQKDVFAGEAEISKFDVVAVEDGATPAEVVEAMIRAVKLADEKAWRRLFADWRTTPAWGGRWLMDSSYSPPPGAFVSEWERSRRLITTEVYDARVERTGRVRRLVERDSAAGLPEVDQVEVWVDHYGRTAGGEYRTFVNVNVHRQWTLERVSGGPWRITSFQHL